jgi:hypothetical protein
MLARNSDLWRLAASSCRLFVADGGLPGDGLGRDLLLEVGGHEPLLAAA